jgi:hypothetical protein
MLVDREVPRLPSVIECAVLRQDDFAVEQGQRSVSPISTSDSVGHGHFCIPFGEKACRRAAGGAGPH